MQPRVWDGEKKNLIKQQDMVWCASEFLPTAHSLLYMSMRGDVMNVCVLLPRVRRDRKSRSDGIADCQNWQGINSESGVNEIEAVETSEVVDGRQKVHQGFAFL